jgi:hypothetical protein
LLCLQRWTANGTRCFNLVKAAAVPTLFGLTVSIKSAVQSVGKAHAGSTLDPVHQDIDLVLPAREGRLGKSKYSPILALKMASSAWPHLLYTWSECASSVLIAEPKSPGSGS